MGFLRRKNAQPILQSRNPIGLPSAQTEPEDEVPNASMIAAKAAAANLMKQKASPAPQPQLSQPVMVKPSSARRLSTRVVHSPSQRSLTSSRASPVYPRLYDPSIENLSLHEDQTHSLMSLATSSLAAHAAIVNSTDYLAPPPHHRVYGWSPSTSALSSQNSLDSPPLQPKLSKNNNTSNEFFNSFSHPFAPPNASWSDSDHNLSGDESEGFGMMMPKSSFSRTLRGSTDNFPSTIPEHSPILLSGESEPYAMSSKAAKPIATRKAPPMSPPLGPSESSTSLSTANTLPRPRRPGSPRRKPPPDVDNFDEVYSLAESEQGEEELPRYPLLNDNDQNDKKRHSRHHGLRKGAKNILKKGLKSSYTPSSFLGDTEGKKPVQLRTTLRKEKKKDIFNEDKPWKHHVDCSTISDQERKRYEGVWVSNKGLYMDLVENTTLNHDYEVPGELNSAIKAAMIVSPHEGPLDPMVSNLMLNAVAREIWQRSKLPSESLRQIWDLVDTRHDGTLDRTSFIVGMWLVDQCLYGRKLPKAVDAQVWNSVSHLGVSVVIKPRKIK